MQDKILFSICNLLSAAVLFTVMHQSHKCARAETAPDLNAFISFDGCYQLEQAVQYSNGLHRARGKKH